MSGMAPALKDLPVQEGTIHGEVTNSTNQEVCVLPWRERPSRLKELPSSLQPRYGGGGGGETGSRAGWEGLGAFMEEAGWSKALKEWVGSQSDIFHY